MHSKPETGAILTYKLRFRISYGVVSSTKSDTSSHVCHDLLYCTGPCLYAYIYYSEVAMGSTPWRATASGQPPPPARGSRYAHGYSYGTEMSHHATLIFMHTTPTASPCEINTEPPCIDPNASFSKYRNHPPNPAAHLHPELVVPDSPQRTERHQHAAHAVRDELVHRAVVGGDLRGGTERPWACTVLPVVCTVQYSCTALRYAVMGGRAQRDRSRW